jgi:DNA polymerase III delta subunit
MIKILQGNEFLIREYLDDYISKKFKNLSPFERKYSLIRNPQSLSEITNISSFGSEQRIILWDLTEFKKLDNFNVYVIPTGTDIFFTGKIDKRLVIYKSLKSYGVEEKIFKDLYPNQIENWIIQRRQQYKVQIMPDAVKMLALMYGTNLSELDSEMKRLTLSGKLIDKETILATSAFINTFSVFELQDTITSKNIRKSLLIVRQMFQSGSYPYEIMRYLMSFFDRLYIIKLGDKTLIDKFKWHPYVIKKHQDVRLSMNQIFKALDVLRKTEIRILSGIDAEYSVEKGVVQLCTL